jgi:glycyl-tRNA synthetase beta chain
MIDFLLEIGFEEFPPAFLKKSADELSTQLEKLLEDNRIFYRSVRTIYTPRRIGALILGLSRKQKPQIVEIQGPPKKVAFDSRGRPTEMLRGFMNAQNVKRSHISVKKTKKGEYVFVKKEIAGVSTEDILYGQIPKIIRGLEFPKTMMWPGSDAKFPRPVRWVVALLDRRPLRFKFAGVKADRYSMPNQHFSFKPIRIEKPREYIIFLRHGGVVVDPNERRRIIIKRLKQAASKLEGKPVYTDEMIEEINCVTEYPEAATGEFDARYLDLPEEVLMTVLKTQGNLIWMKPTNKFVCIFSAKKKALQNVRRGYMNVVAAKLYDAHFYYKNDLKQGLESMLEETKEMMWLQGLGSLYDKTVRLNALVELFKSDSELNMKVLKSATKLCKADLLSNMVREKDFTALQGIMGGYYAQIGGVDERVGQAIKEHYLPRYVGDAVPKSKEGAVISVVDKIDNVVGAFLSGNRPSGSYDPLGIRRNAYAVVNLLDNNSYRVSLFKVVDKLLKLYNKDFDKKLISGFFKEKLARYLHYKKFKYDEINAVLAVWNGEVADARMRCLALKEFRNKPEFTKLVIGQKRVRNILKGVSRISKIDPDLFKEKAARILHRKGQETETKLQNLFETRSYSAILDLLLDMRGDIDKFFDDVLVMCEDKTLKDNRLALVDFINKLFLQFADFSQIVIEGEK